MLRPVLNRLRGPWFFFPIAALSLVLLSACSLPPFLGGSYTLLLNSVTALQQVKSAQTTFTLTENTQVGTAAPTQVKVDASGVVAGPQHQFQVQLTPPGGGAPITVQVTGTQGKEFVQMPGAPAIAISTGPISTMVSTLLSSQHLDLPTLLGLAQQMQIADDGVQVVNGMQLHHLTITLNTAMAKQLLALASKQQKALQPIANALEQANGTIDLYIDDQTSLIHTIQVQGVAQYLVPSGTQASTRINVVVTVSNYNQVVHITAPTNVISITATGPTQGQ